MDERQVIEQCMQGNLQAFSRLVNHYQSKVVATAMNIIRDKEEARDVAQDVFIQVYKNFHRFDSNKSFKNWILAITVKRCIDRSRRQKSFMKFFHRYRLMTRLHDQPENKNIEESIFFHPLLRVLSEKERSVLVLQLNENCTAKEIGAILGVSENTARVHLFNARKKLKKLLLKVPAVQGMVEVSE